MMMMTMMMRTGEGFERSALEDYLSDLRLELKPMRTRKRDHCESKRFDCQVVTKKSSSIEISISMQKATN